MAGRIKPTTIAIISLLVSAVAPLFVSSWATLFALLLAKGVVVLGIILLLQAGQVSFGHAMFFATGALHRRFLGQIHRRRRHRALHCPGRHNLGYRRSDRRAVRGALPGNLLRNAESGVLDGAMVAAGKDVPLHQWRGWHPSSVAPALLGFSFTPETFQYVILYSVSLSRLARSYRRQRYLDSPLGHMLRAIKSNETRLEYLGTSARRVLLVGMWCLHFSAASAARWWRSFSRSPRPNSAIGPSRASSYSSRSSAAAPTLLERSRERRCSSACASTRPPPRRYLAAHPRRCVNRHHLYAPNGLIGLRSATAQAKQGGH